MRWVIIDISHDAPVKLRIVAGVQYVIIRRDDVPKVKPNLKGLSLIRKYSLNNIILASQHNVNLFVFQVTYIGNAQFSCSGIK